MVQIIEEPASFGQIMGRGLGQIGGTILADELKGLQTRRQAKAFEEQFGFDPRSLGPEGMQAFAKKLGEAKGAMGILQSLGNKQGGRGADLSSLTPAQRQMIPFISPQLERYLESQEKIQSTREKIAEPELLEKGRKARSLESSGLRFERLGELFSSENEEKFPPALLAAAFTKEGELRPTAAASLSPEAQESVKLVADELSGAKDSFGARVTNFDLQAYMKRLPTLLNTAEGRRRVLRDLRIMNKINSIFERGVLEVVDRYGGPGKISLSKAENIWEKENAEKVSQLRKEFIKPGSVSIDQLDDVSAFLHPNTTVEDSETGQRFISNGETWEML